MKQLIFTVLLFVVPSLLFAQNKQIQTQNDSLIITRSTIAYSGSSEAIYTSKGTFIVSSSIGQASAIGTFESNGYIIRQGFQQPIKVLEIIDQPPENNLNLRIFPLPFKSNLSVEFEEEIQSEIVIQIYSTSGMLVFDKSYQPKQMIDLELGFLAKGHFIIKIVTKNKKFVSNLIKQ